MEQNLNFDTLYKLEKWSNGAEILVCDGGPSYLLKQDNSHSKQIYD